HHGSTEYPEVARNCPRSTSHARMIPGCPTPHQQKIPAVILSRILCDFRVCRASVVSLLLLLLPVLLLLLGRITPVAPAGQPSAGRPQRTPPPPRRSPHG